MVKHYDLNLDYNLISSRRDIASTLCLASIESVLAKLSKKICKKVEVVIGEKDFAIFGAKILGALNKTRISSTLFLVKKDCSYKISRKIDLVIAVGDDEFLKNIRCNLNSESVCYAVSTTPYVEELLHSKLFIEKEGEYLYSSLKNFDKIIIDEEIILKAKNDCFAKSYISVMSKLTSLLDYKINSFLAGTKIDGEVFSLTMRSINLLASIGKYENYKRAILGAELILLAVGDEFIGSGVDVISKTLNIFADGISKGQAILTAFEKCAKIYHMYFSNDFSNLLSVPDYLSDLEEIEKAIKVRRDFLRENLKIPDESRKKLIDALILKISEEFKKETTLILSVLPNVIKTYRRLNNKKQQTIYYKQIKSAVTLGSYLTDKISILTLCRDQGILKCAN